MTFVVSVYITTDPHGEWWERIKSDGSTRMWVSGTAIPLRDMEFKTEAAARAYAEKYGAKRFKVLAIEPPIHPSRTWNQTVVAEYNR